MTLYYFNLGLEYDKYIKDENDLRYEFQLRTRFISNYFSKKLRRLRFKTDGNFNMLSISLHEDEIENPSIRPIDVLNVQLPFDRDRYLKIKGTSDFSYYLELLELGFKKASEFKQLPTKELLNILNEFIVSGCKNEWLIKKKRFKSNDLEIILKCKFTTNDFQVSVNINQITTKKELVNGIIITTEPDENVFDSLIKNIIIDKDILIKNKFDKTIIEINKQDVFNRILNYQIIGDKKDIESLKYKN
ncbi:hypothetical protein LX97_03495 [Nonlabens dokdonensis]|uniref:Uncharacterized protein n=2 Tax=Nonlabens dokdonensis TaxID=328515 RepID=L7WA40_NONDD|nr:hypothetical protein [Nonlabens dokdonensis]AGC78545.1 hypothetical protein DDD_3418 [Nonlabens dokdonensis DSW-6]PZX36170.1 hypothetical protein LX97_03495 [Nonlabens dokdonensis]